MLIRLLAKREKLNHPLFVLFHMILNNIAVVTVRNPPGIKGRLRKIIQTSSEVKWNGFVLHPMNVKDWTLEIDSQPHHHLNVLHL